MDERQAIKFITRVAPALHVYGTPSHQLEHALQQISIRLGLTAQFLVTPTSITASFGGTEQQRTYLVRVDQGAVNLAKTTRLNEIIRAVFEGRMDLQTATSEAEAIHAAPAHFGPWLTTLSYALASATACRFFDGSSHEILVSLILGLMIGGGALLAEARA